MTTATPPRVTYRSVFAVGEFRVLFAGMLMFVLGFEFEILGLSVLVYARTGSGFLAAVAFSVGFLPQAVGGAFLNSLADRLPPRAVIAGGLLARAAPGLVIGLWTALPVAGMLALVAAAAVVTPVFLAGTSRVLPDVLSGDRYILGRSVFSLTGSGVQIAGLAIGGAILAAAPVRWLLLLAGGSLAAAAVIMRMGLRSRAARADAGSAARTLRGTVRASVAGNSELLAIPRVRGLLLAQWLPVWFGTGAESLIVPYTESLGHPPSAAGPLLAAVPFGMLLGDVVVGRFCRPGPRERLAFALAMLIGAPLLALAFRPPLPVAAAAFLLCGFGYAYPLGIQQAFLDSLPARLRGQGFGLNTTGQMAGQGLLPSAAGGAAALAGPAVAMAAAGAAVMIAASALRRPLTGASRQPAQVRCDRPPPPHCLPHPACSSRRAPGGRSWLWRGGRGIQRGTARR